MFSGDPGSHVHGAIIGGVFRGQIHLPSEQETYHIEKSEGRFEEKPVFHSVIYKESDTKLDPYKYAMVEFTQGSNYRPAFYLTSLLEIVLKIKISTLDIQR